MINKSEIYVINGINLGPLLFKFLTSVITIDTRATITNIRMDLTNLDAYLSKLKFDINKFNLYIKEKRKQLRNRGETLQDILVNLFKVYEVVPDQTFHNWNHKEGIEVIPYSLMLDALNQYQLLKTEGKWRNMSPEDKTVVT